ncbi:MAG: asparagine synthetase B [Clostridia bacterium]|nr:asparagine synthetase B [Clostridia bacterium]
MCGILGIFSRNDISKYRFRFNSALKKLKHRGPNHTFSRISKNYALGYVRLAIRGGRECNQPIFFKDGFCFGNGENYEHFCHNKNDLSDLIDCVISKNDELFNYDADFALAIIDSNNNKFYLARDRFGVKPLFYTWLDVDTICFSSEIEAIKTIKKIVKPSSKGILDYLVFGYNLNNRTIYDSIYCFPRRSIFEWDCEKNIKHFHQSEKSINLQDVSFQDIINKSVNNRLVSDHKIATHLSGGLDSTMVTLIANKILNVKAYTAYREVSDRDYSIANLFAKTNNINHRNVLLKPRNNYNKLIKILNSPIMSTGAFVQLELAKAIHKEGFKVLLEGQGADEILFGYSRFNDLKNVFNYDKYIQLICNSNIDLYHNLFNVNIYKSYFKYFSNYEISIKGMQTFYINNFLQELLKIEDHVNMHYSIENRTPFLSKYFENYLDSVDKIGKIDLKNYHNELKTNINTNLYKINGNISANEELKIQEKNFRKLLNKNYLNINCESKSKILDMFNSLDIIPKKDALSLWALYNILLWCKINRYKKIDINEKELDNENKLFITE